MVNHVVLFKLKDYPKEEKVRILDELKALLESLQQKITEVKFIEVGVNYELEAKSYDLALVSYFESIHDLEVYKVHPEHMKVAERIKETTAERAAVDYYF
jgi:arginine deiminase